MGALLTYYLRDGLASPEGAPVASAAGPRMVLTVTDAEGKLVRQIDASNQAGLASHAVGSGRDAAARSSRRPRWAWRTRRARRRCRWWWQGARRARRVPPGPGGRSGPLVKPGTYQVTLGKLVNGTVTSVGQPQTVEVAPLEASNR
ncbi:MAG: hypothetical protein ACLQU1_14115 [Bryobacteraceae bacterium]